MYRCLLYLRNQIPKVENFFKFKNAIGGDWLREGVLDSANINKKYVPVDAKLISPQTFYIKISDFEPSNAHRIDSIFKVHNQQLSVIPNLILDLRGNGGGSDFSFGPLLPYIYSGPFKSIGADVYATEANITNWRKEMNDPDFPAEIRASYGRQVEAMEKNKGQMVGISTDEISDTGYKTLLFPKKIVILIDRYCASTTEEFLLIARQSAKVTLMGESTGGTLDYSNSREQAFKCMPYILRYSTTRSRRLNEGKGIDGKGINPYVELTGDDWINEAVKFLQK